MSADKKNNSSNSAMNTNVKIDLTSQQKIIDMSNQFYLEISKSVLSEKEYNIVQELLIDKCPIKVISKKYELGYVRIRQIYQNVLYKVKTVSGLLKEIDSLKEKRNQLRKEYITHYNVATVEKVSTAALENKRIFDSSFPFSSRLWNMLKKLEVETFTDLFAIPIANYPKYRGFKGRCMKEFISFIEFENLEGEFEGFYEFKEKHFL